MLMVRRFVGGIISTTEEDIERMEKKKEREINYTRGTYLRGETF